MKKKIAYLIVGEHLTEPLLRRQVVELLGEMKEIDQDTKITVVLFYSIPSLLARRADLEVTRRRISNLEVGFVVVPTLCPWPIPNFKFRKTTKGWRPAACWDRWSLRFFKLYALPVLLWIRLVGGYRIFHCRSYPPASAATFLKHFVPRTAILFDPRSDFPEENVTAGNWSRDSADFRYWKTEERRLLHQSDAVACIAPTYVEAFRRATPEFNHFIAPNNVRCSEFKRSADARQRIRTSLGVRKNETVFVYLGSLAATGWHQPSFYRLLYDNLARFIDAPVFLFLVPEEAESLLRDTFSGCARVMVVSPKYSEIAAYLSASDIGMMLLHKAKTALGTKVVEYFAASLPIVVNRNCEGAADLLREHPEAGCIVDLGLGDRDMQHEFSEATVERILNLRNSASAVEDYARANFDNFTVATQYVVQYSRMSALLNNSRAHSGAKL